MMELKRKIGNKKSCKLVNLLNSLTSERLVEDGEATGGTGPRGIGGFNSFQANET